MGQGSIIAQHQGPPPNMIHRPPFNHSTSGVPEFDRLPPHMQQKMHMQDNLQRHHLMQGFPGGGPPGPPHHHSPHVNNQMHGLIPELNPSQGFPFAHHQPNYGMPPAGITIDNQIHLLLYPLKILKVQRSLIFFRGFSILCLLLEDPWF